MTVGTPGRTSAPASTTLAGAPEHVLRTVRMVDGARYRDISALLNYGRTAVVGTFGPTCVSTTSDELLDEDVLPGGVDLLLCDVRVDQTLAGTVTGGRITLVLAPGPGMSGGRFGVRPGGRSVLFVRPTGGGPKQLWIAAGVNQGLLPLDDRDGLHPPVDATATLRRQIELLADLDGLRREIAASNRAST